MDKVSELPYLVHCPKIIFPQDLFDLKISLEYLTDFCFKQRLHCLTLLILFNSVNSKIYQETTMGPETTTEPETTVMEETTTVIETTTAGEAYCWEESTLSMLTSR